MKIKRIRMNFKQQLIDLGACPEAIIFVGNMTMQEAWTKCQRGDWMLWLYQKLHPTKIRQLTLAKGHCANTVRHLMKDIRSRDSVDVAIKFGEGKATEKQLIDATAGAFAAYAAAAGAAAAYAAAAGAAAAADVDAAAAAAAAGTAASYAAAAGAAAAGAAAAAAAFLKGGSKVGEKNQKKTAEICRRYLKI